MAKEGVVEDKAVEAVRAEDVEVKAGVEEDKEVGVAKEEEAAISPDPVRAVIASARTAVIKNHTPWVCVASIRTAPSAERG